MPFGLPRIMSVIFPMEIVVTPNTTHMLFDYALPRRIYTDGRAWPNEIEPSFYGYSIGKWIDENGDGKYDVLEIESRGFKSPRTYEASGMPLHEDGESVIKERLYLDKSDPNTLHDEITVTDHALTRPWTVVKTYKREPNPIWYQNDCSEDNRHVFLGKEHYVISADDFLMPAKKDQAPPDLRYFKDEEVTRAADQRSLVVSECFADRAKDAAQRCRVCQFGIPGSRQGREPGMTDLVAPKTAS